MVVAVRKNIESQLYVSKQSNRPIIFSSQAAADLGDTDSPELRMRRKRDIMSPKHGLVPSSLVTSDHFTASVWKV